MRTETAIRPGMRALRHWPATERRQLWGVFSDIDDTLTTAGAITPDAWQALAALRAAGLRVILVTGRPIGWCAPLMHGDPARGVEAWPVDAMVAENGSTAFVGAGSLLSKLYQQDAQTRVFNAQRMQAVAAQIVREVPGARPSTDSAGRETDIAIDHSEHHRLAPAQVARVVHIMQSAGMTATVSSIHINGWYGLHNKLQGARWILQSLWGRDLDAELAHWAYVGDSTNDQVMFQHFPHSIGVANVRHFVGELAHLPRYVTPGERGQGFAEVADAILAARASGAGVGA